MEPRAFVWVESTTTYLKLFIGRKMVCTNIFCAHLLGTFSCLFGAVTRYLRRNHLGRFIWFIQDLGIRPTMMRKAWDRDAAGSLLVEQETNREEGEWSQPNSGEIFALS